MPLPHPLEITIPSTADQTPLSSRIYVFRPSLVQNASSGERPHHRRAAIVAHPYATLGGSFDDPVVHLVVERLFEAGFVVLTFNFRRRASWSSRPERKDYITVTRFLAYFMQLWADPASRAVKPIGLEFVLAGYSYGAMIASQTPPVEHLLNEAPQTDPIKRLALQAAENLATSRSFTKPHDVGNLDATQPAVMTRYLLVSPVLPPVTTLLTCSLRGLDYTNLKNNNTMAIFGTKDHFTSGERLRKWATNLGINTRVVQGAGHFWAEDGAAQSLVSTIYMWAASDSVEAQTDASTNG